MGAVWGAVRGSVGGADGVGVFFEIDGVLAQVQFSAIWGLCWCYLFLETLCCPFKSGQKLHVYSLHKHPHKFAATRKKPSLNNYVEAFGCC